MLNFRRRDFKINFNGKKHTAAITDKCNIDESFTVFSSKYAQSIAKWLTTITISANK
jgi:hypothetical protein